MLQARMVSPGEIVLEQAEKPRTLPGYVLLRIGEIGICGSDIHVYHGKHPFTPYPVIQGHEFSAEVAEVGDGVTGLVPGMLVTVEPSLTCGRCYACRHGRYNICDNLKVMGFQTDGAAREYFAVPADHVVPLPPGLPRHLGALIEPLAVAVHAVRRLGEVEGRRLLVLGAGPIGNLVGQTARALGASGVAVTDLNRYRVALAAQCGLSAFDAGEPALREKLAAFFGPDGPDGILECVGAQGPMDLAIELARKGTRLIVVGVFGAKACLDMAKVQDRELELIGTLMYRREDYVEAADLVRRGLVDLEPLITHRFKMAEYDRAYRLIEEHPETVMKVLIEVGD